MLSLWTEHKGFKLKDQLRTIVTADDNNVDDDMFGDGAVVLS